MSRERRSRDRRCPIEHPMVRGEPRGRLSQLQPARCSQRVLPYSNSEQVPTLAMSYWVSVPSPNGERVRVRGDISGIHPHPNLLPAREKGLRANVTLSNYALKSCRYKTDTSERVRKSRSLVTKRVAPASRQVATRRASAGLSRWRAAFSRHSPVSAGGFQSPDLFAAES